MVVETTTKQNSVELEASLAPAEAEVGAEAKADQYYHILFKYLLTPMGSSIPLSVPETKNSCILNLNHILAVYFRRYGSVTNVKRDILFKFVHLTKYWTCE